MPSSPPAAISASTSSCFATMSDAQSGPPVPCHSLSPRTLCSSLRKVRQHVGMAPAGIAGPRPAVVIVAMAADVDEAVDRARAAERLAARPVDLPPVHLRLGLGLEAPVVDGVEHRLRVPDRDVDPRVAVGRTGFEQQHRVTPVAPRGDSRARSRPNPRRRSRNPRLSRWLASWAKGQVADRGKAPRAKRVGVRLAGNGLGQARSARADRGGGDSTAGLSHSNQSPRSQVVAMPRSTLGAGNPMPSAFFPVISSSSSEAHFILSWQCFIGRIPVREWPRKVHCGGVRQGV